MKIVDANVILRYLLNDHEELSEEAETIIKNNELLVVNEVVAEVVYVLAKVYGVGNKEISDVLLELFGQVGMVLENREVVKEALILFGERRLDFVDTLLYAYCKVEGYSVFTFDKGLNKLLEK